jgi:hypothetical protein
LLIADLISKGVDNISNPSEEQIVDSLNLKEKGRLGLHEAQFTNNAEVIITILSTLENFIKTSDFDSSKLLEAY